MRFRAGMVIGFGVGYYLGAQAGRERYEQLNRLIKKVKRSEAFDVAADKAKAVVDLGVERAKDVVDHTIGGGQNAADDPVTAGPLATGPRSGVEYN